MTHGARTARYATISSALALHSDQQLARLVDEARPLGAGIGGTTLALQVEGVPVFAKRIRLTDRERQPDTLRSTANHFALPAFCQRNVGSVGFGVWRELAANVMATGWVLSGQLETFPLMYHWRVLDGVAPTADQPGEWNDPASAVRYWGGAAAMGARLEALAGATASVLIFLEHLPSDLASWLSGRLAAGPKALASACAMVERCLTHDVPKMNALGLLHGDAHFNNILTDGQRLYYADLGLATSRRFALSTEEEHYLNEHANLDRAYVLAKWVNWLVKTGAPPASTAQQRFGIVRAIAQGRSPQQLGLDLPAGVSAGIHRHAAVAVLVNDFYIALHGERRDAHYPRQQIEAALQADASARPSPA